MLKKIPMAIFAEKENLFLKFIKRLPFSALTCKEHGSHCSCPHKKTEKQKLFLAPSENSGRRVNHCPENWRERRTGKIPTYWKQKPRSISPLLATLFLFHKLYKQGEDEIFEVLKKNKT